MRKILVIILFVLAGQSVHGQNRINYSQYMHNHASFNPAFIELNKDFGGSLMYRNQWSKIAGAPQNAVANLFGKVGKSGFGLQFLFDQITIFRHFEMGATYNYSLRVGVATFLSFGVKASFNQRTADYTLLENIETTDPFLSGTVKSNGLNMGFGMFARHPKWHAGLGAPYLFNNASIDGTGDYLYSPTYQHFFLTGGYRAFETSQVSFYPTTMMKWAKGSPLNASIDLNFMFDKRFFFSTGYRTDKTVIISAGIMFWEDLKLVYSYDIGLGKYSRFGGMTHEISLGYGMDVITNHFVKRKYVKKNKTHRKSKTPRRWRKGRRRRIR